MGRLFSVAWVLFGIQTRLLETTFITFPPVVSSWMIVGNGIT